MNGDFVAAAVVILIGACFLGMAFYIMDTGGLDQDDSLDMEFEDYRAVTKPTLGINGPIELVTVDGTEYVHATGIGECTVVYQDGDKETFEVKKASTVLVLMNGQSNAAYYPPINASTAISPDMGQAFYFGWPNSMPERYDDVSDCEFYDFVNDAGDLRVGDKGPAFCKYYGDLTGKKTIWISLGIPGRVISYWNPPNGLVWEQNSTVMDKAMSILPEGFEITRTILLWAQGESDYNHDRGYQQYLDIWQAFHDAAPSEWGIDIDEWYLVQGRTKIVGWVNQAFDELAQQDGVEVIATGITDLFSTINGYVNIDDVHYTQAGDNALGTACAYDVARSEGYSTGTAPIILMESIIRCAVGDSGTSDPVLCHRADGTTARLETTWSDEIDTDTPGIQTVTGTISDSSQVIPNCPAPLMTAYVGYIGYVNGLEYTQNEDGDAMLINRNSLELAYTIDVPSVVEGYAVTEIWDYALQWAPWKTITIPDSVSIIGTRAFQSLPLVESLTMSDSLTSLGTRSLSALSFFENGTEITDEQYMETPSILAGEWEWNGITPSRLYKVVP